MKATLICIVTSVIFCAPAMAYDWGTNPGDGSATNPYQISTPEQLMSIGSDAILVTKHYMLTDDIVFDPDTNPQHIFSQALIAPYTGQNPPVTFTGVFDGSGYSISALTNTGDGFYMGLFGVIGSEGIVKNLAVENVNFSANNFTRSGGLCGVNQGHIMNCQVFGEITSGWYYVGGLCGMNMNTGTIQQCHADFSLSSNGRYVGALCGWNEGVIRDCDSIGTVSGQEYVGGLCGKATAGTIINSHSSCEVNGGGPAGGLTGGSGGNLINCYASGTVSGAGSVGGLCGFNVGLINSCFSTGNVEATHGYSGGLCGYNNHIIINCYAIGTVTSTSFGVGGLCGTNVRDSEIVHCYSTGTVTGSDQVGGLCGDNTDGYIENSFFLAGSGPVNGAGAPLTDTQMKQQTNFVGWDFVGESQNGTSSYWFMQVDGYPQLKYFDTPYNFAGQGTDVAPYLLASVDDLGAVWQAPFGHYRLTNDIDFTGVSWSVPVVPFFRGDFDGNGHSIVNLVINGGKFLGLFGTTIHNLHPVFQTLVNVENAAIRNASVENLNISGRQYVGGLCGLIDKATVENCHVDGTITSTGSYSGGICAYLNESVISNSESLCDVTADSIYGVEYTGGLCGYNESGIIRDSHSISNVDGDTYTGGLCGVSHKGSISNCYSHSVVSGGDSVGGLCGMNWESTINNSYSEGQVTGQRWYTGGLCGKDEGAAPGLVTMRNSFSTCNVMGVEYTGGLCGWTFSSHIQTCYASGTVTGNEDSGGLVGYNDSDISNCYATGNVTGDLRSGGLCGDNREKLVNCYSSGIVTGNSMTGGFCGTNSKTITSCYFFDGAGLDNALGTPLDDPNMMIQANFTGWDFVGESVNAENEIWRMCTDGVDTPRLSWEFAQGGDFACGNGVDLADLQALAEHWLMTEAAGPAIFNTACDANGDAVIDLLDFAVLGQNW